MADPKKPDPKKPSKGNEPYQTAHGPLPAEYWDNDQRFTDKPPGEVYDYLTERDKDLLGKTKPKK